MNAVDASPYIRTIEWEMMDKTKFFPLSMMSSFTIRCVLYPFTVIKTRIQVQRHDEVYKGLIDACRKIYKYEGVGGMYKGFWLSTFQIVSGLFYVTTYESVRHFLRKNDVNDSRVRALVGGGCASLVGQTIIVPFDVMSQHMMVLGQMEGKDGTKKVVLNPLGVKFEGRSKAAIAIDIMKQIYHRDGVRGFYRGYVASLCTYVPNSAMWWSFYHMYQDELYNVLPEWVSHLFIQCSAATLGGFTTTILTNPLDIVRARLQVQRLESMHKTFTILWEEERMRIFTKGLTARLFQSVFFSCAIILGYESIKRMSVNEEYKEYIRW